MNPVRPGQPGPLVETARADAARMQAQRAFFAAAMGAPVQARAAPEPTLQAPVQRVPDPASLAEPPQKILRPGSLLDIRV